MVDEVQAALDANPLFGRPNRRHRLTAPSRQGHGGHPMIGRACAARRQVAQGHPDTKDVVLPTQRRWRLVQTLHGRATARAVIPSRIPPRDPSALDRRPARRGRPAGRSPPAELAHHGDPRRGRSPRTRLCFGTERNVGPGDRQRSRPTSTSRSTSSPDRARLSLKTVAVIPHVTLPGSGSNSPCSNDVL